MIDAWQRKELQAQIRTIDREIVSLMRSLKQSQAAIAQSLKNWARYAGGKNAILTGDFPTIVRNDLERLSEVHASTRSHVARAVERRDALRKQLHEPSRSRRA